MWVRAIVASVVVLGCHKPAAEAGSGSASPSTKGAGSASDPASDKNVERATAIMNAQLGALKNAKEAALVDTFAKDAVVLVPTPRLAHGETTGLPAAIARLSPHDTLKSATVTKLVSGSSASAVWWSAEVNLVADSLEAATQTTSTTIRVTELATADANWKVVAGAFAEITASRMRADPSPIDDASTTAAGPLTPLAVDVAKLDIALGPKVTVFGTDEGEVGWDAAASHALLAKWKALPFALGGKPRALAGKDWAFAITPIDWQQPKKKVPTRMSALLIGTPTASGGWQVVAVQYTPN